jgi:ELWxxDGT repeat protein
MQQRTPRAKPHIECLEERWLPSAVLVQDLNTFTQSSSPSSITGSGALAFFVANDGLHGRQVWKTDGTTAAMVAQITSIFADNGPSSLTDVNGTLFFVQGDTAHGRELWKTDGTTTSLVADIAAGSAGSNPSNLLNINGTLYFSANDGVNGAELWKTDGTNTSLVADINSGAGSSNPSNLTNVGGTLYFTANDGVHGTELWKYDGTSASLVADINPGAGSSNPNSLTNVGGTLFFTANDGTHGSELWKSNGSTATLVADIYPGSGSSGIFGLTAVGGTVFFAANDGTHGSELWKSDGTTTSMVADIIPGAYGSFPSSLTALNNVLFFAANDGVHGIELWKSDGTTTSLVADINPGGNASNPSGFAALGGALYFQADDGSHGVELWKTDGTTTGLVADILPGAAGSSPTGLTNVGGTLFFAATDVAHGTELWKSDGTGPGTALVQDINALGQDSAPTYLTPVNGTLFFVANDGVHGQELAKSDGTVINVIDIFPGANSSYPSSLTPVGNMLYFTAYDGVHGNELWKTDGTTTSLAADINPGALGSYPTGLVDVNGTLYFAADDGQHGPELWKYDGTTASLVADIRSGSVGSSPANLTNVNGTLFFTADDGIHGRELWKYDGTAASLVADITPGTGGPAPSNLTNCNGTLYFADNNEVWKSDGTTTTLVSTIDPILGPYNPFLYVNGLVFFTGADTAHGEELWATDGTNTNLVADIYPGTTSGYPVNLTALGNKVLFTATDPDHGSELWESDGTTTSLVADLNPGTGSSNPFDLIVIDGKLFFLANDGTHGQELWMTDGTTTTAVGDFSMLSVVNKPAAMNSTFFVEANDVVHGYELWKDVVNQPPVAQAGGPYSVAEGGSVALDGTGSSDPNGTIVSYEWDFNYTGSGFTVDATGPTPTFSAANLDGPEVVTVALRVTDTFGAQSIATSTVTVNNVPPTAVLGNNGPVDEGSPVTVSFTGASDPSAADTAAGFHYSYATDPANLATTYATATDGASKQLTFDDNGSYTVYGRIFDKDNGSTDYQTTVTVNNVAPTAGITGPLDGFQGVRGQTRVFTLSATDPSAADTAAGFTFAVTWGDGSPTQTVVGLSGITASHAYAAEGNYTVSVTATDKDKGTGSAATALVPILIAEVQAGTLVVAGTGGADTFDLTPVTGGTDVGVAVNGVSLGSFHTTTGQVQVYGYGGGDTLNFNDQADTANDTYTVTSSGLTRTGAVTVSPAGVENLIINAGSGSNPINVTGTAAGTAVTVNGGGGNDTINVGNGNTLDGIQGALTVNGQAGTNRLNVNDQSAAGAQTYTLSATTLVRSGAAAITYGTLTSLVLSAGSGGDAFVVSATPSIPATLIGGAGTNSLIGPNAANTWIINGPNAGTINTRVIFSAVANLVGNAGNDTFKFSGAAAQVGGSVSGGSSGTDKLDYSANGGGAVAVNLQTGTATSIGGTFSHITSVAGSSATTDTLTGVNNTAVFNVWTISGTNAGKVVYNSPGQTCSFTGIEDLVGGSGVDQFKFLAAGTVLSVDGGGAPAGQGDWLDYGAFTTPVTVNLATGAATHVHGGAAGFVTNIMNVFGGNGGATLTGSNSGNVLVGGNGADLITGGAGRSILVGGKGADQLFGGSGASAAGGDILIGDTTTYDSDTTAHMTALMALLAEWQSTDDYGSRFSKINTGTGIPGGYKLAYGSTVTNDGAADTLTAAASRSPPAVDWFFGTFSGSARDNMVNFETGEHVNNT